MPRTSARSISRDLPPSPLKHEAPTQRNTRSTRSQSIDLDANRYRQESVESTGSNNKQRSRRATRKTAAERALSVVEEDREISSEEEEEEEENVQGVEEDDEDPDATKVAEPSDIELQAIDRQENDLEERVLETIDSNSAVEALPDLYDTARRIINKSANKKIRPKDMERHSKILNSLCEAFEVMKEPYGTEQFIEVDIVLRKLFGSKAPATREVLLSAILNSANLATLTCVVKEQRQTGQDLDKSGRQKLKVFLQSLEKSFPGPFVSRFTALSVPNDSEHSKLIQESFNMFLDIRTQLFITVSRSLEAEELGFDPDRALGTLLLQGIDEKGIFASIGLDEREERAGARIDQIRSTFKPAGQATGPGKYVDFERLEDLYPKSEFYDDLVSYAAKRLAEVEDLVEARGGIENVVESFQDLAQDIESDPEPEIEVNYSPPPKSVTEREENSATKKAVPKQPPHKDPRALKKLAELKNRVGSQQLDNREGSPRSNPSGNARFVSAGPSLSPAEVQQQDAEITEAVKAFKTSQNKENQRPGQRQGSRGRLSIKSTATRGIYKHHPNAVKETWDENSQGFPDPPLPRIDKRKILPREVQTDDEEPPRAKSNKRKNPPSPEIEVDDEDFSSDQGFQRDKRNMPPRRTATPTRPFKRARAHRAEIDRAQCSRDEDRSREGSVRLISPSDDDDQDEVQRQSASEHQRQRRQECSPSQEVPSISPSQERRGRSKSQQHPSRSRTQQVRRISQPPPSVHSVEMSDDDSRSPVIFTQIQGAARVNIRKKANRIGTKSYQTREVWSDADTKRLIRYIEEHGADWSIIEKNYGGEFDRDNITQVNLKDRARNIKVYMVLAGQSLPRHFNEVRLNAALLARVRVAWPEYDPHTDLGYSNITHQKNYVER
ncbi:hypothetical protein EYC80_010843 [Monilinia laxa]|uniref:Myb-like domain-containing protein n=1 Tax=Monilinia laxa TaxID=61186 RepID=A0A5N6JRZ5_MONLA|nr:hypothetical protein EYC80_010843 [Monilinia laxa]